MDGCDLVSGLQESVRLQWNGDIDFGDGDIQLMHNMYLSRLKRVDMIITADVFSREKRCVVLQTLHQ